MRSVEPRPKPHHLISRQSMFCLATSTAPLSVHINSSPQHRRHGAPLYLPHPTPKSKTVLPSSHLSPRKSQSKANHYFSALSADLLPLHVPPHWHLPHNPHNAHQQNLWPLRPPRPANRLLPLAAATLNVHLLPPRARRHRPPRTTHQTRLTNAMPRAGVALRARQHRKRSIHRSIQPRMVRTRRQENRTQRRQQRIKRGRKTPRREDNERHGRLHLAQTRQRKRGGRGRRKPSRRAHRHRRRRRHDARRAPRRALSVR